MNVTLVRKSLALLALAGLAACNGGSGSSSTALPAANPDAVTRHNTVAHPNAGGVLARIAGVGDSLTAGYQAQGFLGATNFPNPYDKGTDVPPGQENGFWAVLDEQASGLPLEEAIAREYDPATSPLPLIAGPGLNNQIVPQAGGPPGSPPIATLKAGDSCSDYQGFDAAGFFLNGNKRTRLNPGSTTIRNVAVPGITLHETNVLYEPQTTTCEPLPGVPGLLSLIVNGESSVFWPVLGNFAYMGSNLSEVNAAASLHPTITTVWLGANDVLKYMGTGGRFLGGDNTVGQVSSDLSQVIRKLYVAGSASVVANLPNVLETPYFERAGTLPPGKGGYPPLACAQEIQNFAECLMINFGIPSSPRNVAQEVMAQATAMYHLGTPGGCTQASTTKPCGYLTLAGVLAIASYIEPQLAKNPKQFQLPDLDGGTPGGGLGGEYITPGFAAKIQTLNNTVNEGIEVAVQQNNVPMVDVRKIFDGIASGDKTNPYFRQATAIEEQSGTSFCCTLAYGHGLVSFDGLHPSNTGYAFLAYYFIQRINQSFHLHVKQVNLTQVLLGKRCSNPKYCFPDPYKVF